MAILANRNDEGIFEILRDLSALYLNKINVFIAYLLVK